MEIGLFFHKIHQFEPDTGQNTQDRCVDLRTTPVFTVVYEISCKI